MHSGAKLLQVQCIPWDVARHLHSVYKYRPRSSMSVELGGRHPDRSFDALMAPMRVLPVYSHVAIADRMEQQVRHCSHYACHYPHDAALCARGKALGCNLQACRRTIC